MPDCPHRSAALRALEETIEARKWALGSGAMSAREWISEGGSRGGQE
jgi:hypothetical protein